MFHLPSELLKKKKKSGVLKTNLRYHIISLLNIPVFILRNKWSKFKHTHITPYYTQKISNNLFMLPDNQSTIFPDCLRSAFRVHLLYSLLSDNVTLNSFVILTVCLLFWFFPCQWFVRNNLIIFQAICPTECRTSGFGWLTHWASFKFLLSFTLTMNGQVGLEARLGSGSIYP